MYVAECDGSLEVRDASRAASPLHEVAAYILSLDVYFGVRRYLHSLYTYDGVRSAFHQFPGIHRFYGVLVGSSPTLPSSNSYPLFDSYSLCYKLTLTASPSFGLCKGGDVL